MKLLLIGDLHFKYKDEANVQDLEILSSFLVKTAESINGLTKIIVLGDILDAHERIDLLQLTRSVKLLEKLADVAPLVVIIGNHDRLNAEEFLTDVSPFYSLKRWKDTIVADAPILETINNKRFLYVPYVSKGRFMEAISTTDWKSADIIFAHQDFAGAIDNHNYEVQDADPWSPDWPPVYSGHIHKHQKLRSGVTYVGTPYQTRYGECLHKHILLLDIGQSIAETYIDTNIRKKIDRHMTFAELKNFKLEEGEKQHLIKIHVKCTSAEAKKVKKMKALVGLKNVSVKTEYVEEEWSESHSEGAGESHSESHSDEHSNNSFFQELEKMVDAKQLFWLKKLL